MVISSNALKRTDLADDTALPKLLLIKTQPKNRGWNHAITTTIIDLRSNVICERPILWGGEGGGGGRQRGG